MVRTGNGIWEIAKRERRGRRRIEKGTEERVEGIFYGIVRKDGRVGGGRRERGGKMG